MSNGIPTTPLWGLTISCGLCLAYIFWPHRVVSPLAKRRYLRSTGKAGIWCWEKRNQPNQRAHGRYIPLASLPLAPQPPTSGAHGKLASTIAQHQGAECLAKVVQRGTRDTPWSRGTATKQAVHASLNTRTGVMQGRIEQIERGNEVARLQSAAEEYALAKKEKQEH
ncbi:hypothetical protein BU26DRAFT_506416 [Trematosphaeria pertusa]|uniref:Uncharacterized protein n=1 Tax=Trematosphaeria pertusa TaxID=390896 RepID=A0A6A6IB21_9PLEO|nr:uncharacterized protein BU26DRAFT_506416 [Trematosphaeria pertusa]KAF2247122.1 hypothetical protein BU26DRAFT_506416 [Trematosphaeria pertusa]